MHYTYPHTSVKGYCVCQESVFEGHIFLGNYVLSDRIYCPTMTNCPRLFLTNSIINMTDNGFHNANLYQLATLPIVIPNAIPYYY